MNIKHILTSAILATAILPATAAGEHSPIYPVPQNINITGTAFDSDGISYRLTGSDAADADAVAALDRMLDISDSGTVEIIIGKRGDAAVAGVSDRIPDKAEGYYLSVTPAKVIIAGNDDTGTYYGVQSFLQLADNTPVPEAEVTDWPAVAIRGVIEGFYGNPWSMEDRVSFFEFAGQNKMNIYVYGPKDDNYHRSKWAEPYPEEQAETIRRLVEAAESNKVKFTWAMHPSNQIDTDDFRKAAINKFEQMYGLGVRSFSIFFDDISGESVATQVEYLNHLTDNFIRKHPDVGPLSVCPTAYNEAFAGYDKERYLRPLGTGLYPEIMVMWTGAGVVDGDMISTRTCEWFTDATGRKPFIWLNYPVNDYGGQSIMMSPFKGADPAIAPMVESYCSNPMEYAEASKVALYGIADFSWHPETYEKDKVWEYATEQLAPDHVEAFRTFCRNNYHYHSSSHGLRVDGETPDFKEIIEAHGGITAESAPLLEAFFSRQTAAARELLDAADSNRLFAELREWIIAMELQGRRGNRIIRLHTALSDANADDFINTYKEYIALTEEADNLISRPDGTVRNSTHPTTGMQSVEPFIASNIGNLVADFKESGAQYPADLFPLQAIENGSYYIVYDGRYLSNGSGAAADTPGNPSFKTEKDNINPNRQVWKVRYDSATGRYSIKSAHDDRYINELGNFGTNEFESAWHTYTISSLGNIYAIQNGGSAGSNFWQANRLRVSKSDRSTYAASNFIFQIVPEGTEIPEPATFADGKYTIADLAGRGLVFREPKPEFELFDQTADIKNSRQWQFTYNKDVDRWEIRNYRGNKYINEHCVIGVNQFDAAWNTYELYELNGKFAIRNCVHVGGTDNTAYWTVSGDNLAEGADTPWSESFNFVITPVNTQDSAIEEISGTDRGDNTVYDLTGRRIATPRHGLYIINGKKVIL